MKRLYVCFESESEQYYTPEFDQFDFESMSDMIEFYMKSLGLTSFDRFDIYDSDTIEVVYSSDYDLVELF